MQLRFAWTGSDADVELETSLTLVGRHETLHTSASRVVQRRVRRSATGGWRISYGGGDPVPGGEESGIKPENLLNGLVVPQIQGLLELPAIDVGPQGELTQAIVDEQAFAAGLQTQALQLLREYSQGEAPSDQRAKTIKVQFDPAVVRVRAEEDYDLVTAAWIGATLDQGHWYRTEVDLTMPGARQLVLLHDVEFAYTRRVACVEGAPERSCVEIVVHASPQPASADEVTGYITRALHLPYSFDYWSATYMRIVVDPDTLTPYLKDARRYWHFTCEDAARCEGVSAQQRILWRSAVPHPVQEPAGERSGS